MKLTIKWYRGGEGSQLAMLKSWRKWLIGVIGAAINSGASAVSVMIVDPHIFDEWGKLAKVMTVSAVVGAALFLKQHPIPVDEE